MLSDYRKAMRAKAVFRDDGKCMICKWTMGVTTPYAEVHHVFGRGTYVLSPKEDFTSLMSVCRSCHPQPLLVPMISHELTYILTVWRNMNCSPANMLFRYDPIIEIKNPIGLPVFKVGDGTIANWSI